MNDTRRKQIKSILARLQECSYEIDDILDDEEDARDSTPERFVSTERYEKIENAIDRLESASEGLGDVIEYLEDAAV